MTVSLRYRLFLISTALLYMGPLVAGLAGFGWQMIAEFTAIFMLWLVVMRPAMWPEAVADWGNRRVLARFMFWAVIQAVIVAFCFAIGRGIGGTAGTLPPMPVWVPPLMSLLAVPVSRILWNPSAANPEMAAYVDRATLETDARTVSAKGTTTGARQQADEAARRAVELAMPWVKRLAALPETTREQDLMMLVNAALQETSPLALLQSMSKVIDGPGQSTALRRAFVMAATDTEIAGMVLGQGLLSRAFDLAGEDATRLRLFAERCARLLRQRHLALMDTPQVARMIDVATRHPAAAPAIHALIDQMSHLSEA